MRTYLGAASQLSPEEINEKSIVNSSIVYLEGYLWDEDLAKSSCKKALELSKKNNVQTALSLSDSFCVTKWHEEILDLTKNVDIVFGNEEEFKELNDRYKSNDLLGVIDVAVDNKIEFDYKESDVELMNNSIKSVKEEIEDYKNKLAYVWKFGTPFQRGQVISTLGQHLGKPITPDDLTDEQKKKLGLDLEN